MDDGAPQAPAGWYPVPDGSGSKRYWDGEAWVDGPPVEQPTVASDAVSSVSSERPPEVVNRLASQPSPFWFGLLACVLMVVGGLGTWATALGIVSVSGTRGDGWIVVGAAVGALFALWGYAMRPRVWIGLAAALFGTGGAVASAIDLHKLAGIGTSSFFGTQVQLVHPAWGIYLALGASVVLAGLAIGLVALGRGDLGPAGAGEDRASNASIVFVTVLIAIGIVVLISNVGTRHAHPELHASSNVSSNTATTLAAEASSTESTPSETSAISTQQVQDTLNEYAAAYSAESTSQLREVFAETLVRRDGTHSPEDLSEALATYEKQFAQLQDPTYELSTPEVSTEEGGAAATATYSITSQNGTVGGNVTFHLVPKGSGVGIDQLTITPNP